MSVIREGKGEIHQRGCCTNLADLKEMGATFERTCKELADRIRVPSSDLETKPIMTFEAEIELKTGSKSVTLKGTLDGVFEEAAPKRMQSVRFIGRSPTTGDALAEVSVEMRDRRKHAVELLIKPMNADAAELIHSRLEGQINDCAPGWSFMLKPIGWVLFAAFWILLPAGTVSMAFAQSASLLTTATAGAITTVVFGASLVPVHKYIFPKFHLEGHGNFSRVTQIFLEMIPIGVSIVSWLFSILQKG